MVKTAYRKLEFLSQAEQFFSPSLLLLLYETQILSSLEYCLQVWGDAPLHPFLYLMLFKIAPFVLSVMKPCSPLLNLQLFAATSPSSVYFIDIITANAQLKFSLWSPSSVPVRATGQVQ